jgi:hypothetical protein
MPAGLSRSDSQGRPAISEPAPAGAGQGPVGSTASGLCRRGAGSGDSRRLVSRSYTYGTLPAGTGFTSRRCSVEGSARTCRGQMEVSRFSTNARTRR